MPQSLQIGTSAVDPVSFNVSYSSTLALTGHLTGKTTDPARFKPDGKIILNGKTGTTTPQDVETWSVDRGANSSGFSSNLAFGTISVENSSAVRVANTSAASSKALYVNTLAIASGSRFDANNRRSTFAN